ncbi:MAG: hypothetical protein RBG13Loki_2898 [Promethearchaeota archaeon CR_4]|nr:MAG: hypothetical protein RBG13Loki_2898 [Candidatus Lokiarchaeota archaeon CR_4]
MQAQPGMPNPTQQALMSVIQHLDGTLAQMESLKVSIEEMSRQFMENIVNLTENLRLIIGLIREQRTHFTETIQSFTDTINSQIKTVTEKRSWDLLSEEQKRVLQLLRDTDQNVADNLYLMQLLSITQSIRELAGRALATRLQTKG